MSGSTFMTCMVVVADAGEYARRVNAAAELLASGVPVAEAARVLAARFGCSVRQARRYVERAAQAGRAAVPEATVFTVRLPACWWPGCGSGLGSRGTISALVAQALTEFLARGHRSDRGPRRR